MLVVFTAVVAVKTGCRSTSRFFTAVLQVVGEVNFIPVLLSFPTKRHFYM